MYESADSPELLHQTLSSAISWQKRNGTAVAEAVYSPNLAPQWAAALLALGARVEFPDGDGSLIDFLRRTEPHHNHLQALGFAHSEEMVYDGNGRQVNARFGPYHLYKANETPALDVIFVQTDEPSGPFGAKSVAEISMDGVAPALANAIHDATGLWIRELSLYPERVWQALQSVAL